MVIGLIIICGIFLGGWILQLADLDKGRWQCLTMFVPAAMLLARGMALSQKGKISSGPSLVWGGLVALFGLTILFAG